MPRRKSWPVDLHWIESLCLLQVQSGSRYGSSIHVCDARLCITRVPE
jgi:hypothetical protein